ncbi:MAG TPA: YkgJ family cysteine cluster protein [Clostridiales bacterium]|nr:YkgJ family cysteine cluster protein [Clostridiales bacterium]HQP69175.1 YkgJ family cysteine cluster protein [Clostridiales bacterium]
MITTKLNIDDKLPLTCSRAGACCFGNLVLINPWELVCLAREKKITPRAFRDLYCEYGGIRLRFNGKAGWKGKQACSQYLDDLGCSVYSARPLACRLYPLGRQIQNEVVQYIYQGDKFPCLEGCPEVAKLPYLSVGEYLIGQMTGQFEKAQDAYLEMMQSIADIAFMLILDTGLAGSGDKKTLPLWRKMGSELPEVLANRIGNEWIDRLILPEISDELEDPVSFVQKHNDLLQSKAQEQFEALQTDKELHEASVLMMGVALHLARSIGTDPKILSEHWIGIAKEHGAIE